MEKKVSPISKYLSYTLAAAHRNLNLSLNRRLREMGVQVETWRVLESLNTDAGHTMGELAEVVLLNPPTLTKLVDRMVADGLVHRQVSVVDHRQVQLVLTDLGLELTKKIRRFVDAQNDEIIARLGAQKARDLHEALRSLS